MLNLIDLKSESIEIHVADINIPKLVLNHNIDISMYFLFYLFVVPFFQTNHCLQLLFGLFTICVIFDKWVYISPIMQDML